MRQSLSALRPHEFCNLDIDAMQRVVRGRVGLNQSLDDVLDDIGHISGKDLVSNSRCFFDSTVFHITCTDNVTKVVEGVDYEAGVCNGGDEVVLVGRSRLVFGELCEQ